MPGLDSWFRPYPIWSWGNAVWYAPGIMEATAAARGLSMDGYVDGVAFMTCANVGHKAWLKRMDHNWEGPFRVVDCAQQNDIYSATVHKGEVVEVGWETAVRWGLSEKWREEGVQVSLIDPALLDQTGRPIHLPSWWGYFLEYADYREARPLYQAPSTWRIEGEWITFLEAQPPPQPTETARPTSTPTWVPTATAPPTATLLAVQGYARVQPSDVRKEAMTMEFFEDLIQAAGPQVTTILVLVGADTLLGLALAIRKRVFDWAKLADFYTKEIIPKLLGYVAVLAIVRFANVDLLGPALGPVIGDGIEWTAWLAVVGSLGGSVLSKIAELGLTSVRSIPGVR